MSIPIEPVDPGSVVPVSGSGFVPGETVAVLLHQTTLAVLSAGVDGRVAGSVTIPQNAAAGPRSLTLRGEQSARVATATLTVRSAVKSLSYTGSPTESITALAALLIGVGGLLLAAARQRRQHAPRHH